MILYCLGGCHWLLNAGLKKINAANLSTGQKLPDFQQKINPSSGYLVIIATTGNAEAKFNYQKAGLESRFGFSIHPHLNN